MEQEASKRSFPSDKQALEPHFYNKCYSISIWCRLCRQQLLVSDKIKFSHSKTKEDCGNCIFLDEEFLPSWIQDEIENSSWTKGRLKCPRIECTARVGGFDFIKGLLCSCGEFNIPAIWIQDGKVDVKHLSDDVMPKKSSFTNINQCLSKQKAKTSVDAATSPDVSNLSEGSFYHCTEETYDLRLTHSVHHNNDISEVETLEPFTSSSNTTSALQVKIRPRRRKTSPKKISLMHQNIDNMQNITNVMPQINVEVDSKRSSNRFNSLAIEQPSIVKTSDNTRSPHEATEDHLICAVCLDYFYKPYQCPCSHIFCESCLRQLYHNCARNLKCPICRGLVKYIEPASEVQKQISKLQNAAIKQRKVFEKTAKYRKWPLPPIGPLPFLRKRQTLVPSRDQNLVKWASILLFIVCCLMLYISS